MKVKTEKEAIDKLRKLEIAQSLKTCPLLQSSCISTCVSYTAGRYYKRGATDDFIVCGPYCSNLLITGAVHVES